MKTLTTAKQIRDAIQKVQPTRIAVAFIGEGWNKYISTNTLEEIIISPTNGSNPKAIEQIMLELGEDRVHFLDNLHAKFFIGKKSAIVGSCNLSNNGMADKKLLEAALLSQENMILKQLSETFEKYKRRAINLYPNEKAKRDKLIELAKQWQKAEWYELNTEKSSETLLINYKSALNKIHVVGFNSDFEYNHATIEKDIPEIYGSSPDDYFSSAYSFLETDAIFPGEWILGFSSKSDGYPRKNGLVEWVNIHYVIPNGAVANDNSSRRYTKLAGEVENLGSTYPPFKLNKKIKRLIRELLSSNEFPELLDSDNNNWSLKLADKKVPAFIKRLQEKL